MRTATTLTLYRLLYCPAQPDFFCPVDTPNLSLPDYFINRELSALEFNRRVLAQAQDESIPILERLKFLCIVSTNLDEFFEIRVSGLQQRLESGATPGGPDMMSPHALLQEIGQRAHDIITQQYEVLNEADSA